MIPIFRNKNQAVSIIQTAARLFVNVASRANCFSLSAELVSAEIYFKTRGLIFGKIMVFVIPPPLPPHPSLPFFFTSLQSRKIDRTVPASSFCKNVFFKPILLTNFMLQNLPIETCHLQHRLKKGYLPI